MNNCNLCRSPLLDILNNLTTHSLLWYRYWEEFNNPKTIVKRQRKILAMYLRRGIADLEKELEKLE